jgi:hypothetical protein
MDFFMIFVIGVLAVLLIFISAKAVGNAEIYERLKGEAIELGYASYCPLDGRWAWKGQCDSPLTATQEDDQ